MSFKNISPAKGRYVLKPATLEEEGTFKVAEDARDKPEAGVICGVGGTSLHDSGRDIVAPEYEMGDTVLYRPYTGHKQKFGGQEYILVAFGDVLGKVTE